MMVAFAPNSQSCLSPNPASCFHENVFLVALPAIVFVMALIYLPLDAETRPGNRYPWEKGGEWRAMLWLTPRSVSQKISWSIFCFICKTLLPNLSATNQSRNREFLTFFDGRYWARGGALEEGAPDTGAFTVLYDVFRMRVPCLGFLHLSSFSDSDAVIDLPASCCCLYMYLNANVSLHEPRHSAQWDILRGRSLLDAGEWKV